MERETKDLVFEIKEVGEDGTFEGVASAYGPPADAYGDIIDKGAFTKTIKENGGEVLILWQHDTREPIGTGALEDTDKGLLVKGRLELGLETAQKARISMAAKLVKGLSIGFKTIRKRTVEGVRHLKEIQLYEISPVTFSANERALITDAKSAFSESMKAQEIGSKVWGAYGVLDSLVYRAVFDREMSTEDKVKDISEAVDEFKGVFLGALPEYLKLHRLSSDVDDEESPDGKKLSPENAKLIEQEITSLEALLKAGRTSADAAATKPEAAEQKRTEPEVTPSTRSDLAEFRDALVGAIAD